MLFDSTPKTRKEDFFDREEEIKALENLDVPLAMILGPRRIGKTSLIKVFLNETKVPGLFIDCRRFSSTGVRIEDFISVLSSSVEDLSKKNRGLRGVLRKISGLKVFDVEVKFNTKVARRSIVDLFHALNDWASSKGKHIYVVFDEAQNLKFYRRAHGILFNEIFGYVYDNLKNIKTILTGSEIGLLEEFIGLEDPSSPLYGRYVKEIWLRPFTREESLLFLETGFDQFRMKANDQLLEKAVDVFDGVVGWLVYFGKKCVDLGRVDDSAIYETLDVARKIVEKEIKELSKMSYRYINVLKAIAMRSRNWSKIKEHVEMLEGRKITDASLGRILSRLEKMGFVEKKIGTSGKPLYRIVDPMVDRMVLEIF
jgi:AAA+ ATPase superfamily predicted ATPase